MINLGFIGTGNMAGAIIKGIYGSEFSKKINITAYDLDKEKLLSYGEYGVTAADSESDVVNKSEYILLGIKPQGAAEVLSRFKNCGGKVIISIMAGISAEYIKKHISEPVKVVLAMPNMPIQIGEGAVAISREGDVTDAEFAFAASIFECGGIVREVPMDKMKEVICINASSPAFIYQFTYGFMKYAAKVGIDENAAKDLFAATMIGSAKMLLDSPFTVQELIAQITSPGGTTLAGLEAYKEHRLDNITEKACENCTGRAYELGR